MDIKIIEQPWLTKKTRNVGVRMSVGMYEEIEEIMKQDKVYLSTQEFIRLAIKEKIDRWKEEHAVG